jgi:TonB-linked SusC/RagA family outer membrane protein
MTRTSWAGLPRVAALIALLTGTAAVAQAQNATIQGRVTTDQGRPIEGANVFITELSLSVGTNAAGNYVITVPGARVRGQTVVLRARSIGQKPDAKPVVLRPGTITQNFALEQDANRLSEVVVTGVTGATEQTKTPFAISRVTSDQMPVVGPNPLTQLQGKVAGAQIVGASGRPGASPSVILRAPTSINASGRSQEPLYVVDGIIITGGLPDLNPEDMESVEVVKGAAAASLYGARAGNGVIQITTKTGKSGAQNSIKFGFRSEIGVGDLERTIDIAQRHGLSVDETGSRLCTTTAPAVAGMLFGCYASVDYQREALRINQRATDFALTPVGFPVDPGAGSNAGALRNNFQDRQWPVRTFDAVGQLFQPQPTSINNFDVTGRYGKTTFFASVNRLDQGGTITYLNGFQRTSMRVNVDQQVNDKFSFNMNSFFSRSQQDGLNQEDGNGAAFFRLTRTPPLVDLTRRDSLDRLFIRSNLQGAGTQNENALYSLQNVDRNDINDRFLAGATARYSPMTWLDLEGNFSFDNNRAIGYQNTEKGYRTTTVTPATNGGNVFRFNANQQSYNASVNATARWAPTSDLRTRYTVRYIAEQQQFDNVVSSGSLLQLQGVPQLGNTTATTRSGSSFQTTVKGIGFFGSVNAEYKDRYIIDALVRRDGSSLFGAEQRWQNFGRASVAWRATQEGWWFIPQINELKLRGSYGTAGGRPNFFAQYETFSLTGAGVPVPGVLGNNNLRPEVSNELEYGADFEIFKRLGGNITYAKTRVTDQILQAPLPAASGFTSQWTNAGTLENSAFEVSLNLPVINRPNFSYTARLTYDRIRSQVTELTIPAYNFGTGAQGAGGFFRVEAGVPFGTVYGRKFVRNCSELPGTFAGQCGGDGSAFQKNSDGFIVWTGAGNSLGDGVTKNLWQATLPATAAPFGVASAWGHPLIQRDTTQATNNPGRIQALGNVLPKFRWSTAHTMTFKRISLNGLVDATVGRTVHNQGLGWSLLDFLYGQADQDGQSTATARPQSYYYRAGPPDNANGIGGLYDVLGPNDFSVEKATFARLRELVLSYKVGKVAGVGNWNVSLIGRNVFTWTNYRGFDPEVGISGSSGQAGSGVLNAVDNFTFPNIRTFTFSLGSSF